MDETLKRRMTSMRKRQSAKTSRKNIFASRNRSQWSSVRLNPRTFRPTGAKRWKPITVISKSIK